MAICRETRKDGYSRLRTLDRYSKRAYIEDHLGTLILIQIIQGAIGYFQRKERSHSESDGLEPNRAVQFETRDTAKLLNETPTIPASVTEHSTKLFPVENKTRKLE